MTYLPTGRQMREVRKLNHYFSHKLKGRWLACACFLKKSAGVSDSKIVNLSAPVSWFYYSEEFVKIVMAFQESLNTSRIGVDGILGNDTVKEIESVFAEKVKDDSVQSGMLHCDTRFPLMLAGKEISIRNACYNLKEGFLRHPHCYGVRTDKKEMPTNIVLHWDAAMSSESCMKTLLKKELSIHFTVDSDGTISQHLDTGLRAFHATSFNDSSIGIEINNPYYPKLAPERKTITELKANTKTTQETYIDYTDKQYKAVGALVQALCYSFSIPKFVPESTIDAGTVHRGAIDGKVSPEFNGVVGHCHIQENKIDPGFKIMEHLVSDFGFFYRPWNYKSPDTNQQ